MPTVVFISILETNIDQKAYFDHLTLTKQHFYDYPPPSPGKLTSRFCFLFFCLAEATTDTKLTDELKYIKII